MTSTFPRLRRLANLGDMRLALVFEDGRLVVVDLTETANKGGVYARLSDPSFFAKARISQKGRALAWPGGLDFCADSLYGQGAAIQAVRAQGTPFGARVFELI